MHGSRYTHLHLWTHEGSGLTIEVGAKGTSTVIGRSANSAAIACHDLAATFSFTCVIDLDSGMAIG